MIDKGKYGLGNLLLFLILVAFSFRVSSQASWDQLEKVKQYQLFEISLSNETAYTDPVGDVELLVEIKTPDGRKLVHYGFYAGDTQWKIRFSPDVPGVWTYRAHFSDRSGELSGTFACLASGDAVKVTKNEFNPFWLGKEGNPKTLFRSFHAGDRFFAFNWDDPSNPGDGNKRTLFLDWLQKNKYNMLSVASFFSNRDLPGRGKEWDTPKLWPIDPLEYQKMEVILDDLKDRGITVFPFAGFFGAMGEWPTEWEDQQIYVKYLLACYGHYPNIIFNIAGPEPFWQEHAYKNSMHMADIRRLGLLIDSLDIHRHILTVHNEKRATQYGDPFIDEPWMDMSTLQGPTTASIEKLYSGLSMNHRRNKVCYAQETLWAGNKYHPDYSLDQLRKNTYAILFSGCILNFADNDGNSSTGFSGNLDLSNVKQEKHDVIRKVFDWFEGIPFYQMTIRQDVVNFGYCLANEGVEYYVYLDTAAKFEFYVDFPYSFSTEWINAKNTADIRKGPAIKAKTTFETPVGGDDWILHVYTDKPSQVAIGNFPDLAVDHKGNLHIVYNRNGLKYRKYNVDNREWFGEQGLACACANVRRSDPDIVIDSHNNPHVFCGNEYAFFDGEKWTRTDPSGFRDTELAIDANDKIYFVHRGGKSGHIGLKTKKAGDVSWIVLPDPDQNNKGPHDNHVYPDIFVGHEGELHLVQRHGPVKEVTYRKSTDGGKTWPVEEAVSDDRAEAPHIASTRKGTVLITTGSGYVFERANNGEWAALGRKLRTLKRMQPELGVDQQDNIYLTSFGGRYNTRYKSVWMGEKIIEPVTEGKQIGFVETAGADDFAYIIWEEGHGNADEGLNEDAGIFVGILYPDGRVIALNSYK